MLSRTHAGPDIAVLEEQEGISHNHARIINLCVDCSTVAMFASKNLPPLRLLESAAALEVKVKVEVLLLLRPDARTQHHVVERVHVRHGGGPTL